jgi:hypothetical protein
MLNIQFVMFKDGTIGRKVLHFYTGACFGGEPTAYVFRGSTLVWVKPGESVAFIEV